MSGSLAELFDDHEDDLYIAAQRAQAIEAAEWELLSPEEKAVINAAREARLEAFGGEGLDDDEDEDEDEDLDEEDDDEGN